MEALLSQQNLDSATYSVLLDEHVGSDLLLISFGGIANALPIPVFEFMRSLDQYGVNKVFIRDFRQCWYTNGIEGISNSPSETIKYLRSLIDKFGKKKVVFMGNSAGGYAAMLYGRILNVSEVHAFSPQTFIDSWHRILYWDRRWPKEISNLNEDYQDFFDLKQVFKKYDDCSTVHHVYWDKRHRLDNFHAKRMKGKFIEYHSYNTGGHAVIKQLRNSGELESILKCTLRNG
jgi:pimeloyl-ACP methyl ester carboxylesterase